MMHRKDAKRIRMNDSVPPENETPMTPMNNSSGDSNDSYNAYTPYNQASQTPLHNPTPEHYSFEIYSSPGMSQQQYQEQSDSDTFIYSAHKADDSSDYTPANEIWPNQVENIATSSGGQVTAAINNIQEGRKEQVVKENDNLSYRKNNSERRKLSKQSEPGCSKDSDANTSLQEEGFYDFTKLKKDSKLMHALLPKLSYDLILLTHYNNRFARNCIELTLWDLLPVDRPLEQPLKRKKDSDEICVIEHKKNPDICLKKQVHTKGATKEKEKAYGRDEVVADNRKSKDEAFASSIDELEMKKNVSEQAAWNSASNDTNQESAISIKKAKIQKMDEPIEFLKDDSNTIILPNSNTLVSPEVDSKVKEVQSTKNSEFNKKRKLSPENNRLQLERLTFQKNIMSALQKDKSCTKLPEATDANPVYDMNEQYADLLKIFPEADPVYLRKIAEEKYSDPELIEEFVQSKLKNPDYPTRAQYMAKKEITKQQKQYTTDFQVQQFLKIFPDPFLHFEDDERDCEFNQNAVNFLTFYFSKLKEDTLLLEYAENSFNLSLTVKALETKSDMKTKQRCNKILIPTKDIPFLQECAFIQHKAELRKYIGDVKTKEEQEFNELKVRNLLLKCQCCYDNECMPLKCCACEKGHIFCNLCIVRSTDIVLRDGNTRVNCLLQCGCEFPISVLQRILSPTKFSILLYKRQEAEVIAAELKGLVSCPFGHFAAIPPPEDKIFKCFNPNCGKESCRLYKELNHILLKCIEKKSESVRLYLERKITQALVRKCYRCNKIFFKEKGCNKMICVCGAEMCYICNKSVTDYEHFQDQEAESSNRCPLWSDDRRINAKSIIKVCQEIMKQIKEKDLEVDININTLPPELPPKSRGPHENF